MSEKKKSWSLDIFVFVLVAMFVVLYLVSQVSEHCGARMTRAVSEIRNIELALGGVCVDAGVERLGDIFDLLGVRAYVGVKDGRRWGIAEFAKAQQLYTRCVYALLHSGRNVLGETDEESGAAYGDFLIASKVNKLGLTYMDELAYDAWGDNLYQIWPGPWDTERLGTIPFRIFNPPPFVIGLALFVAIFTLCL